MKIKNCTWCNSNVFEFITTRKDGYNVVKCKNCTLFFLSEIPENLNDYYNAEEYFTGNDKSEIGYTENYDLISPLYLYWQKEMLALIAHQANGASLLEIGCATGNLLEILKTENVGFSNITGIDLSDFAVKVCKEKGLNVTQSTIDAFNSKDKFDIIFSSETMEHVDNLKAYIDGVKKHLKENGTFIFYIPAIKENLAVKYKQRYKPFAMNLEHLFFFTKTFLDVEFKKYFNMEVSIHEYTMFDDAYIVGVVSNNPNAVKSLNMILEFIKGKTIKNIQTFNKNELYAAAIISAKFYNYSLSEEILKIITADLKKDERFFLNGVISLHKGELFMAEKFFNKAFEHGMINNFEIKLLYTIKKELLEIVKKDLDQKTSLLLECEKQLAISNKEIFLIKSTRFWKWRGLYFHYKSILNISRFIYLVKKAYFILKRDGLIIFLRRLKVILLNSKIISKNLISTKKIIKRKQEKWLEDKPLVSIVTPFYNHGATLNETIESVLSQTFQDFEYIIVDDGSTDKNSIEVFNKVKNQKIQKIRGKNNGTAQAKNIGIERARGKYILCLDSDDMIDPTYIEKAVSILELNPQYDIIYSDLNLFGTESGVYREPEFNPFVLYDENILICASVFKKDLWGKNKGYKSNIGFEDWEFWVNLVENGAKPRRIPEALFNYRKAENSRFVEDSKKMRENIRKIKDLHPNYIKNIKKLLKNNPPVKVKFEDKDSCININNTEKYLNNIEKKSVLLLMPWLSFGGAESLVYNYCSKINNDFNLSIITGLKSENQWEYKFKEITNNIYHLPNLFEDEDEYLDFIINYIKTRNVEVIHIIHNSCFYHMLFEIKKLFPGIIVISTVFNTMASHFENSINYSDFIDVYTTDNARVYDEYNNRLPNNAKKMIIYNGIDCNSKFNPIVYNRAANRIKMGLLKEEVAVYFIGRLSPEKNPDIFIKAAKKILEKYANVKFFIIGDGLMRSEIEKFIYKLNNKNLIYLGYQTDIPYYLSTADIFVLPSAHEGFPVSNIEAMSMEICVISSDVGGVGDAVIDGENGFLIKPNSVEELVRKLNFAIEQKETLKNISKNARKQVEKNFSIELLAENYKKLYQSMYE